MNKIFIIVISLLKKKFIFLLDREKKGGEKYILDLYFVVIYIFSLTFYYGYNSCGFYLALHDDPGRVHPLVCMQ